MNMLPQILLSSIASFAVFFLLSPVLEKVSKPLGLIDQPNHRKLHLKPVPLIGGAGIVFSALFALLITEIGRSAFAQFATILSATALIFLMGLFDDRLNLSAKHRLILQLLAGTLVAFFGLRIKTLGGLFGIEEIPVILQYLITVLIIVGVTNAFNLIDGVDGLAGSIAIINYVILAVVSLLLAQYAMMVVMLTMVFAHLGFLLKNWAPAKIFMGDGGSMMNGFLLSTASIWLLSNAKAPFLSESTLVLLFVAMFTLPVVDALRVFTYRYVLNESIFTPDKSHLHHLLLLLGLKAKWVTISMVLMHFVILISMFYLFVNASLNIAVFATILGLVFISKLLSTNRKIMEWQEKIKGMESKNIY